jgi:hypothetical protein
VCASDEDGRDLAEGFIVNPTRRAGLTALRSMGCLAERVNVVGRPDNAQIETDSALGQSESGGLLSHDLYPKPSFGRYAIVTAVFSQSRPAVYDEPASFESAAGLMIRGVVFSRQ